MKVVIERRDSPASLWAGRLAWFAAVLLVVAGLSHRYRLLETVPFFVVLGIGGLLALVALGLAFAGFADLWEHGDRGGRRAAAAGILALVLLAPYGVGAWRVLQYPRLTDVATDLDDPPQFRSLAVLRPPFANAISAIEPGQAALVREAYPELSGRRYAVSTGKVQDSVLALVAERGWTVAASRGVVDQDPEVTIEIRGFSRWLRYPADIVIRLTDESESTFVDMRSASHFARHDLGDNADRIRRFLADLDDAMIAGAE